MSTAAKIIDPSEINPHGRYPTVAAAEIFGLTPKGFLDRCRRKNVRPVGDGSRPKMWSGVSLWLMLDYTPPSLSRADVERNTKAMLVRIRAARFPAKKKLHPAGSGRVE